MAATSASSEDDLSWLAEIDLDPQRSWLSMGTRALGSEPWLVVDGHQQAELALRAKLLEEQRELVLAAPASADAAAEELLELVGNSAVGAAEAPHPLEQLGRSIQEDLCLLRRGVDEWEFEAGVVCFPSRWSLPDRVGRPMREVHGPTQGFDPVLADRVTSLLDRLGDRIVRRRNWFVHADPTLFQPSRPANEPLVPPGRALADLHLRSERQTLRSLPRSGRVVFTIRTQQCPLGTFLADDDRRQRFLRYLESAPADQLEHRGMSSAQVAQIATAVR